MIYQDKYFDQDKNSILRAAQGFVEPQLLQLWTDVALETYMRLENPMGLMDDFILSLLEIKKHNPSMLQELYEILSAIYRLQKGDNQLEIIWDGRSHYEVYAEEWSKSFEEWIRELSMNPEIYRAILKACILQQASNHKLLFYGMRRTILEAFGVQIGRNKMLKAG